MILNLLRYTASFTLLLFTLRRWLFLWTSLLRKPPVNFPAHLEITDVPGVLIVVPFYNENKTLFTCLKAISLLHYPSEQFAVLLLDDNSTDDSGRIAQTFAASYPHWAYLRLPANVGKAAALNEAIHHYSAASFLVVYDADERPQPNSLRSLLTGFRDERVGGVTGRRVISNGLTSAAATYATYENLVHQHITCQAKDRLHLYPPLLGSNCAYRLTALSAVGGFQAGAAVEDSDLTVRLAKAGWHTRYVPQAVSCTTAPETVTGYLAQHRRWAKGFADVVQGEFRVSSFEYGFWDLVVRLELFLFASGYLDRAALAILSGDWLLQHTTHHAPRMSHAERTSHASRLTSPFLLLTLLTPLLQVIAALWLEKSAAAYWLRLPLLPFFFLLDIAAAVCGIGQSLLGIMLTGNKLRASLTRNSQPETRNLNPGT